MSLEELPSPKSPQAYVRASLLEAGHILVNEMYTVENGSRTKADMVPSMSFLLRHSQNSKNIIFDLGIRKDWENYPPEAVRTIKALTRLEVPVDVVDSLRRGALEPEEIDYVILSHIHFDHLGDPALFPTSRFVVGAESETLLSNGYSATDDEPASQSEFQKNVLPSSRTIYLSSEEWSPIGPFPRAHDFFGDGSVYIIDAPGHLRGHINVLVRTSADGSWLYLGGDSAHDVRILSGEKGLGIFSHHSTGVPICLHEDIFAAKDHISRIRRLSDIQKVQVLIAHDKEWFEKNKDKGVIYPGEIKPFSQKM